MLKDITLKQLAHEANQIWKSDLDEEEKYDQIFSESISRQIFNLVRLDYCDPDTTYKEDVDAFMNAFNEKMDELYGDGDND